MTKRRAGLVAGWLIAAGLAMFLASQAVAMVRDQVTDRPSRAAATQALESTTTTTVEPPVTPPTSQSQTTSTAPASTTTTSATVTTTTAPPTTTTSTSVPPSTTDEATFYLTGGWATVRCVDSEVGLATYAPNPGFQVDIEDDGPLEVEIKFEEVAGNHRSKLEATCRNGTLDHDVEEKEED